MWSNEFCILQGGETALIWACYHGKSEIVSLLLKAGARTDIQEKVAIAQSAFDWLATCDNVMLCTEWPDCPLLGCLSW
jgi:ankyrin repeat protein